MSEILPPEKVAELRAHADRKVAVKREYDRRRREAAKAARAAETEAQDSTPNHYWEVSRSAASQTQIASYLERQEYVLNLTEDINLVIAGKSPDAEFETDVVEEIKADVEQFGLCETEVMLLPFWRDPNVRKMLLARDGEATKTFVRYGIVTALSTYTFHEWEEWVQARKPSLPQPLNNFTTMQCACGDQRSLPEEIARSYQEKGIAYECYKCRRKEQSSRAQSSIGTLIKAPETDIYDSWGRVKDR